MLHSRALHDWPALIVSVNTNSIARFKWGLGTFSKCALVKFMLHIIALTNEFLYLKRFYAALNLEFFLVLLTKECNLCLVYLIGNRKKIHSTYIRPYFCSGYPLDRTASHFETRIILFKQCIIWLVHMVISIFDAAHSELFLKLYFGNWSTYNLCYFYVWNMLDNFWKIHPPKSAKKEPRLAK